MSDCDAIVARASLTLGIQRACSPHGEPFADDSADGSEQALQRAYGVLTGIVNEYRAGGDQLRELCTCGEHTGAADCEPCADCGRPVTYNWQTSEWLHDDPMAPCFLNRAPDEPWPFGLTPADMVLDPAAIGASLEREQEWLRTYATPDERRRILRCAELLTNHNAGTPGECLCTAIIWERG